MALALSIAAAALPRAGGDALPGPIRQLSFAPLLELSLRQVEGPPARPCVREGQTVQRGEPLAIAEDPHSLPVHAPASGTVLRSVQRPDASGGTETRLLLAPWAGDTQEYAATARPGDAEASAETLLARLHEAGIAIGAEPDRTLPLAQRLREAGQTGLLLLNGIDPEPPFRLNGALMRQQPAAIRLGLAAIRRILKPGAVLLAVAHEDAEAASSLLAEDLDQPRTLLRVLSVHYPQGDPRLLPGLLARGRDPFATRLRREGACILPLRTVAEAGELLASGEAVTTRLISIAGSVVRDPGLFRVPLGTPLEHLLSEVGLLDQPVCVLQGGVLRGRPLAHLDVPIHRGHSSFLALPAAETGSREWPCLRCGDCIAACPVGLNPAELGLLARRGEYVAMRDTQGLDACIDCGCCTWVCPARIPLLQRFRAAKAQLRRLPHREDAA